LIERLIARVAVTNGEIKIRYVIPTSPTGEAARFCRLRSYYRVLLAEVERMAGCRDAL
jgi:site-specific DNA recombinase